MTTIVPLDSDFRFVIDSELKRDDDKSTSADNDQVKMSDQTSTGYKISNKNNYTADIAYRVSHILSSAKDKKEKFINLILIVTQYIPV